MGGTRRIWHQGWKASAISPGAPDAWGRFATQRWELFNTEEDPSECHDLAGSEPEKLQELIQLWWAEAGQYAALPLETRTIVEILTTDRPQLTKPRNRYVYYPGTAEVPESAAPNLRNRSYTVGVEVTIESENANRVLHVGEKPVGHGRIKTQPGKFSIAGEGLNIGQDGGEAVTDDYPGERPWSFTGGTIHWAAVDVSGDPFVDLAAEMRMAFMRD